MNLSDWEDHLVWAEGECLDLYRDSVGIQTIGVGHNIEEKGISKNASRFILKEDMEEVLADVRGLDYWDDLDSTRQLVIADMVFNLGLSRFLKFRKFNAAMALKDYSLAAHEMKDSQWYDQVGRRAVKLHQAMVTGEWNV